MKLAASGKRGVFWRANPRGSQELRQPGGGRIRGRLVDPLVLHPGPQALRVLGRQVAR